MKSMKITCILGLLLCAFVQSSTAQQKTFDWTRASDEVVQLDPHRHRRGIEQRRKKVRLAQRFENHVLQLDLRDQLHSAGISLVPSGERKSMSSHRFRRSTACSLRSAMASNSA